MTDVTPARLPARQTDAVNMEEKISKTFLSIDAKCGRISRLNLGCESAPSTARASTESLSGISGNALMILRYMSSLDDRGWHNVSAIAEEIGVNKTLVRKALKGMVDSGLMRCDRISAGRFEFAVTDRGLGFSTEDIQSMRAILARKKQ